MAVHIVVLGGTIEVRTETELALLAEAGNREAREELAARLLRSVLHWVRRWVRSSAYSSIIASEAVDRILEKLYKYNPALAAFNTWAYRVAYHAAMSKVRSLHLNVKEVSYEALDENALSTKVTPAEGYRDNRVKEAVDRLPPLLARVVRMSYLEGNSVTFIMRTLRLSRKQVRRRLEMAEKLLRDRLQYFSDKK